MTWVLNLLAGVEKPDLTVLLDVEPAVALKRISGRMEQPRQSNETRDYLSRVRQTYLDLARDKPTIIVIKELKVSRRLSVLFDQQLSTAFVTISEALAYATQYSQRHGVPSRCRQAYR